MLAFRIRISACSVSVAQLVAAAVGAVFSHTSHRVFNELELTVCWHFISTKIHIYLCGLSSTLVFNVSARCIINYSIDCTAMQSNENFALAAPGSLPLEK